MKRLSAVAAVLLFAAITVPFLKAQDVASVTGVVTDPTGAVIPGTRVVLLNTATNLSYAAETNAVGSYSIVNVPPGPGYRITFSRDGFTPSVVTDVYLNVNTTRTQNGRLTVGGTIQTVEVSAASQGITLNTTDATVGNNYEVQMVNELPVQLRDTPVGPVLDSARRNGRRSHHRRPHRPEQRHARRPGRKRYGHRRVWRNHGQRPGGFGPGTARRDRPTRLPAMDKAAAANS